MPIKGSRAGGADGRRPTADERRSRGDAPVIYTIHVGALLGQEWTGWFDDAEIVHQKDGTSLMRVSVRDQAMLFGLLIRIRDLGIPLVGLYRGPPPRDGAAAVHESHRGD